MHQEADRATWYYTTTTGQQGPFTADDMKRRIASRELSSSTLVWRDGMTDWSPLSDTELFDPPRHSPPPLPPTKPPAASGSPPSSDSGVGHPEVSDGFAWALALAPLVIGLVEAILIPVVGMEGIGSAGLIAGVAINSLFAILDSRRLKEAGYDDNSLLILALLLVPVYLWRRSRLLGRDQRHLIVWIAALLLSLTSGFSDFASGVVGNEIDDAVVERAISDWFRDEVEAGQVDVECPAGIPAKRGETFRCVAEDSFGDSAIVEVEVQNNAGDVIWEVR